jgi:hypothetical protein
MPDDPSCSAGWISCLHTWQDLAGALVAALIAGTFVLFQVWLAAADAREQRAARYRAGPQLTIASTGRLAIGACRQS